MNADQDRLRELLREVSDGRPIDWEAAVRGLPAGDDRRHAEALRDVDRIAEFSRVLQRSGGGVTDLAGLPPESGTLESWGPLLLMQQIGRGSHADVYRAWDLQLRREVALKLLREEPGPHARTEQSPLMSEARAAASVRHPNIVMVHGIDQHQGRVGLWMEFVRGESLEEHVRRHGALPADEVRRLGVAIGSAVQALHDAGVLHRDLKPANLVRDESGRWVLTDFGMGSRAETAPRSLARATGTPMYLAPEVFEGAPHSESTEIYALGLLLWTALVGRHPFVVDDLAALKTQVAKGPSPSLAQSCPTAPPALVAVIERAIAPRASERWGSAREFVDALDALDALGVEEAREARGARDSHDARDAFAAPDASAPTPATEPVAGTTRPRWNPLLVSSLAACLAVIAFFSWRSLALPPAYDVEAELVRHGAQSEGGMLQLLQSGDHVGPGDQLSLRVRVSRSAWVYVVNEDERGERFLLFPQPLFDRTNPIESDDAVLLPGSVAGTDAAWTVTSAGGREHFLVVVSPWPLAELEAELDQLPAPRPEHAVEYAQVDDTAMQRLRGVGGVHRIEQSAPTSSATAGTFENFRSLVGEETAVRGVWVRKLVLENRPR